MVLAWYDTTKSTIVRSYIAAQPDKLKSDPKANKTAGVWVRPEDVGADSPRFHPQPYDIELHTRAGTETYRALTAIDSLVCAFYF